MVKKAYVNSLKVIVQGVGITFVLGMLGYVITFFFKLSAARYFGPSDYGYYEMISTLLGIVFVFANLGIARSISRYLPIYKAKKKWNVLSGFVRFAFFAPIIFSFVSSILVFIYAGSISNFFNFGNEFTVFIRIICFFIPIRTANGTTAKILVANKKFAYPAIANNLVEKGVLLVGVLAIIFFKLDLVYLIYILGLSIISVFLFNFVYYKKTIMFKKAKKITYKYKEWFKFSLPLLFTGVLAYILNWTDNLVIGKYLDPTALGIYGITYSLAAYLLFVPTLFAGVFTPILSELTVKSKKSIAHVFQHVRTWIFIVTVFVGFIFLFFPRQIIQALFGESYLPGFTSLLILSSSFLIAAYFYLHKSILLIKKDTMFLFRNTLFFSVFNLVLNIIFIKKYGTIFSIAAVSGVSLVLLSLSEYWRSRRHIKIGFMFKYLLKVVVAGLVSIGAVKLLFIYVLNKTKMLLILKLAISFTLYTAIFALLLLMLKTVTAEDAEIIRAIEKRLGLNFSFIRKMFR